MTQGMSILGTSEMLQTALHGIFKYEKEINVSKDVGCV
jgi:hypothetical protein